MPQKIILVMAGTRDAAKIIAKIKSYTNFNVVATTTTEYGAAIAKKCGADEVLSGGMDGKDLVNLIRRKKIGILVDATHPFAVAATKNAIQASQITGINYMRFERPEEDIIENDLIHKVFTFKEAALKVSELTKRKDKILHLAGVSTLHYLTAKIHPHHIVARILPSVDSLQKCLDLGLKQENLIAMQGVFSTNFNRALMKEYDISAIITKESGATGGTSSKIEAAMDLGIEIVLVNRPKISELQDMDVLTDLKEIISFILNNNE